MNSCTKARQRCSAPNKTTSFPWHWTLSAGFVSRLLKSSPLDLSRAFSQLSSAVNQVGFSWGRSELACEQETEFQSGGQGRHREGEHSWQQALLRWGECCREQQADTQHAASATATEIQESGCATREEKSQEGSGHRPSSLEGQKS